MIQIRISPKRGKCTWTSNLQTKCRTERRLHSFKFSNGYKSTMTMDWCSVYLAPQALPNYIYLSPPLIFPTTYKPPSVNGSRSNRPQVKSAPDQIIVLLCFYFYLMCFTLFFHTGKSHVRHFCCFLLSTCKVKYFLDSLDTIQQNI